MTTLRFPHKDVLRCIEHALAAPAHNMGYSDGQKPAPALFFVKDDGIYLMSNGSPRDLLEGERVRCHVAYAKGYGPRSGDVWDKCRDAVGGDDFGETLELTDQIVEDVRKGSDIILRVTTNQIAISTEIIRSEDETREWLANLMKKNVAFYPNPRHKRLKGLPLNDAGLDYQASVIRRRYPKSTILNTMPLDKALQTYIAKTR